MVDRVTLIEGNRIVGVKNVSINEPVFQGTSPVTPSSPECCSSRRSPRSPASS
ncbi:MAG: hypothetical protein H7A46_03620 [Verrucomicrobiales bacterium]|nr:hypothetical protein [Verrucomicrobiales bacterium]